jgi:hypothetical protein
MKSYKSEGLNPPQYCFFRPHKMLGISRVTEDHNEVECVNMDWIHKAVEKK